MDAYRDVVRWPFDDDMIELWLWDYTDEFGRRRRSTWRLIEEEAKFYRDAVKVEGSLERRRPLGRTSDFLNRDP